MSSVRRAIRVLEYLVDASEGPTHGALSRALDIPRSTLSGLLAELRRSKWIELHDERYYLGSAAQAFVRRMTQRTDITVRVRPLLQELAEATGETAVLVTEVPGTGYVVVRDFVEGNSPIRYVGTIGETTAMHSSAAGLVILAFSQRSYDDIPSSVRSEIGPLGPVTAEQFERRLKKIRRQGFADLVAHGEQGFLALSAPLLGHDSSPVAAISIAGPTERLRRAQSSVGQTLVDAVKRFEVSPPEQS